MSSRRGCGCFVNIGTAARKRFKSAPLDASLCVLNHKFNASMEANVCAGCSTVLRAILSASCSTLLSAYVAAADCSALLAAPEASGASEGCASLLALAPVWEVMLLLQSLLPSARTACCNSAIKVVNGRCSFLSV